MVVNMNIHNYVRNSLPVIPVLSHLIPVHTLPTTFLKIHFTLYLYNVQMHVSKTVEQHITHLHLFTDAAQMLRICNVK
jgi:hypothetical protein